MINKSLLEVTETSSNKDSMLLESENEISAESITNEKVIATIDSAFPKKDIIVVKDNKTLLMLGLCDKPCVKKIVGDDELELQDDSFSPNTLVLTDENSNTKNSEIELVKKPSDEEETSDKLCV